MTIEDYSKYVINNIYRATISNALKISDKIDVESDYSFTNFIKYIQQYVSSLVKDNKIDLNKFYNIMYISDFYYSRYSSNNVNKRYIINDFIIDLWKIMTKEN